MEFSEIKKRALQVRGKYAELEKASSSKVWSREDLVRGFVGDVGDLVKLTMAADNVRSIDDHQAKLEHELADCLWSLLVISDQYEVDLESVFIKTTEELEDRISSQMESK